ncbi:sodium:solute symporter family protein [Chitinispirillales bacterium ANBcel5]|uniref:sodium:solute symporter family protein n=1 Tax=Cellulosispirillum alkaliphilum TaxID=3039283 RepID=UPI002A53917A|nr:sodium:solute symporter family protein [Chitinispirillales bacterium ANBcel5]
MNLFLLGSIVLIFVVINAFLAFLGYRGTRNASDYLLAGRKAHPVIMALSYGATFISTAAIIGFGGAAAVYGMGILWLTFLNIFVGIFIAFVIFGKRTRKIGHNMDVHTFPEFIGKRFQSKFLHISSALLIFIAMPLYAGSVIIGGTQFITETLGINYDIALMFFVSIVSVYVIMGGLKGVMYADAFQGVVMFLGMFILLIFTYSQFGGVTEAHSSLSGLKERAVDIFGSSGHTGWTSMPRIGSVFWWQLVSTITIGVGIGVLAQPQLIVRFMTVKSNRELNRAVLVGGVFILMMVGVSFIVGALSNAYFEREVGKVSIEAVQNRTDNIIPMFINMAMPPWFTAIFMVTLLAAAMTTLCSQFHAMGSAFGRDFVELGLGIKTKSSVLTTKVAMIITILASTFLAWGLPQFFEQGSAIVAIGTAIFFGLCAATFLPLYVGALFSKRITKTGAKACFISGLLTSSFWITFIHIRESQPLGLCNALFGVDSLASSPWLQNVDPIVVALPVSTIFTIVFSLLSKPPNDRHLKEVFNGVK